MQTEKPVAPAYMTDDPSTGEPLAVRLRTRATGIAIALTLELLIVLLLLTLGRSGSSAPEFAGEKVTTFDVAGPEKEAPSPERTEPDPVPPQAEQAPPAEAIPTPAASAPPVAIVPAVPPIVTTPSPQAIPAPQARPVPAPSPAPTPAPATPQAPPKATVRMGKPQGPPAGAANGRIADSAVVGTAPNGEPLYAASWYREPYDIELRGYLSTASGPGWGLIACRTVADFRVEDCVKLDEWPTGSRIADSVLSAAWQFRVRPPRKGGRSLVGSWVRIRIDYDRAKAG